MYREMLLDRGLAQGGDNLHAERAGMTSALASAAVEQADLMLDERVLAVAHQLDDDAEAGCRPRGASAGRGSGARGLDRDVAQVLQRGGGDRAGRR